MVEEQTNPELQQQTAFIAGIEAAISRPDVSVASLLDSKTREAINTQKHVALPLDGKEGLSGVLAGVTTDVKSGGKSYFIRTPGAVGMDGIVGATPDDPGFFDVKLENDQFSVTNYPNREGIDSRQVDNLHEKQAMIDLAVMTLDRALEQNPVPEIPQKQPRRGLFGAVVRKFLGK